MFLLADAQSRRLYVPARTKKTNGVAASIVYDDNRQRRIVLIGEDVASEKASMKLESVYKVVKEYDLPDEIAELIKSKRKIDELEEKLAITFSEYTYPE